MSAQNLGYGHALFEIAKEKNKLKLYKKQAIFLAQTLKANTKLKELFKSHNITKDQKHKIVDKIFKTTLDKEFLIALHIMIDNNKFYSLEKNLKLLKTLVNKKLNIKEAYLYSVKKLNEDKLTSIKQVLEEKTNHKIELTNLIDKSLIGGVKINIDNKIYDNSLSTKLTKLHTELLGE